jgi:hypothetical protein
MYRCGGEVKRLKRRRKVAPSPSQRVSRASKVEQQRVAQAQIVRAVASTETRLNRLAARAAGVSREMIHIHSKLSPLPDSTISRKALMSKQRSKGDGLSKAEGSAIKAITKDVRQASHFGQIFEERRKLLGDPQVPAKDRIQLLNQMETSILEQESLLNRLGRKVAKHALTIALIGLAAYGLYQAPHLLNSFTPAAKEFGDAAQKAGIAAQATSDSVKGLAKVIVCGALVAWTGPLVGLPACTGILALA